MTDTKTREILALAWIETMAEHEKNGTKPVGYVEPLVET